MNGINWSRVIVGGLIAGLVMNVGEAILHGAVLGVDVEALYASLGRTPPSPAASLPLLVSATFLLGIAAMWVYAAALPRYGAGAKTAIYAGLAVWVGAHLFAGVYIGAGFGGLVTPKLAWLPVAWGLIEAPLATVVGARFYTEPASARDAAGTRRPALRT